MESDQVGKHALDLSDATGGVLLPAFVSVAVGVFKMVTLPWPTTNGQLLLILGVLAFFGGALASRRGWLTLLAAPLGLYAFAVLGCLAFGMAISEGSGWQVVLTACFWMAFGWYVLSRIRRLRRVVARQP